MKQGFDMRAVGSGPVRSITTLLSGILLALLADMEATWNEDSLAFWVFEKPGAVHMNGMTHTGNADHQVLSQFTAARRRLQQVLGCCYGI